MNITSQIQQKKSQKIKLLFDLCDFLLWFCDILCDMLQNQHTISQNHKKAQNQHEISQNHKKSQNQYKNP